MIDCVNTSTGRKMIISNIYWMLTMIFGFLLLGCTYTVDSYVDAPDANPGDFACAREIPEGSITTGEDDGKCTLRAAIEEANATTAKDTIIVPPGPYNLVLPVNAGGGELEITQDVDILGFGANITTINAGNEVVFPDDFDCDLIQTGSQIRVFRIANGNVFIRGITVKGGNNQFGGGIRVDGGDVNMREVVVRDNFAFTGGGGILIADGAKATIQRSSVLSNCATGAFGGGILNQGTLFVYDSTIADNESNRAGGIENSDSGILVLKNTTVSGNLANSSTAGTGGIRSDGFANLNNVTIANNTGFGEGGGIKTWPNKKTVIKNSIVADNLDNGGPDDDCQGELTFDSQDNLIGNSSGCDITGFLNTYLLDVAPKLNPLSSNGGITKTHALQSDSPALNSAFPSLGNPPPDACETHDQRGVPRPQDGVCDMGAVEMTTANSSVSGFVLVDADADIDIRPILHGDTLNLSELPPSLSIRVNTGFPKPASIVFGFDDDPSIQIENIEPYALGGDSPAGNYNPVTLTAGTHTITATPFSGDDGTGPAGMSLTISFIVQ